MSAQPSIGWTGRAFASARFSKHSSKKAGQFALRKAGMNYAQFLASELFLSAYAWGSHIQAVRSVSSVISGGQSSRNGIPTVPIPRLT